MKRIYLYLLLAFLIISCQKKPRSFDDFFNQTFGIIQEKSIKKNVVNWNALRNMVVDSIQHFNNNEDVYRAICYTIKLIDDGHSLFLNSKSPNALTTKDTVPTPEVPTKILNQNIGYIKINGFFADINESRKYSKRIRESLYELDSSGIFNGWVIDLRENGGGLASMMPLGMAPLFQDSLIGFQADNTGEFFTEYCSTTKYQLSNVWSDRIEPFDYELKNKNKLIAVLVSNNTASAAENLASAFRFQPSTKLFGKPTKGKTTGLQLIEFKSSAKLLLATVNIFNKDKELIGGSILPDIECDPKEALDLAIEWINEGHK